MIKYSLSFLWTLKGVSASDRTYVLIVNPAVGIYERVSNECRMEEIVIGERRYSLWSSESLLGDWVQDMREGKHCP